MWTLAAAMGEWPPSWDTTYIEPKQTAMVLTEQEWNDLADICQVFKSWASVYDRPEHERMLALCERIIDAADTGGPYAD